ncbi:tspO/peripheral benzodiazepine receptor [Schizosaccharomyces japonicus yFS275]|uniref:TspO/peripheral benzodiazepine receptor n=1 Tax=Schizosaccharomyces japonicus (strain yFS275 / FY16936) TaxID=402676 RepID=B6JWC5_SCHJY|nr:tspO/peripheral benzodiazepine receptor [Schizosaccharomyces japonicus yFS275]EEB05676.1 tspO/peripheral benzodiazepine receptor [Schizosaccharomyces japonicus yFS275]
MIEIGLQLFSKMNQNKWTAMLLPILGGWFVGRSTAKHVKMYRRANQPKFKPPAWAFGPAWTILYALMGYAAHLAYRADPALVTAKGQLGAKLYLAQLAVNYMWMPLFFRYKMSKLALVNIGAVTGTVIWLSKTWSSIAPMASKLLLPYIGWLGFAGYLVSCTFRKGQR